jgi:hypothetical protein
MLNYKDNESYACAHACAHIYDYGYDVAPVQEREEDEDQPHALDEFKSTFDSILLTLLLPSLTLCLALALLL